MFGIEEIENRFGFHKAAIEGPNANNDDHAYLRNEFQNLAVALDKILPDDRAKAVAFTELETASMWSHKALALSRMEN